MIDILELKMCAIYSIYAFLAAIIYDFGHTWFLWNKSHRIVHMVADTAMISALGMIFVVLLVIQGGILRWYVLAAVFVGGLIYHITIKSLLRKMYFWIFKKTAFLWKIITFPARKTSDNIKKYYKKVTKSCKKNDNFTGNMPLDDI